MDAKVWTICGLAAGFLMCVAAFAGSLDMTRSGMARARMTAFGKAPICAPDRAVAAKGLASRSLLARQARSP